MSFTTILLVLLATVFVNNFVFAKFLGLCPYIGVSKDSQSALGMGLAVVFVMTMASAVSWTIYHYFLYPGADNVLYLLFGGEPAQYDLRYLMTLAFILVIAALVQFVEMVIQKVSPALYAALGIYLPLITTNCAVLAVAIMNIEGMSIGGVALGHGHAGSFIFALAHGFGGGVGFAVALLLMAGIRERLAIGKVPKALQGMPIAFITAALMAIAFMGFVGMVK